MIERNFRCWTMAVVVAALPLALVPTEAVSKEFSTIKAEFENNDVEVEAEGSAQSQIKNKSKFVVKVRGLKPNTEYTVLVGGLTEADFSTNKSGRATIVFLAPQSRNKPLMDFDPRGKIIAINNGVENVLEMLFSGEDEPEAIKVKESTALAPTELAPGGIAAVRFEINKRGVETFQVRIRKGLANGDYEVFVDGLPRGALTIKRGRGKARFRSSPGGNDQLLDFDPRSKQVDIIQAGEVFFSGTMKADASDALGCGLEETEQALASTGEDADADAEAEFRVDDDCEREFEVEVEDLPVGDYDLFVDGVNRGTISVVDTGSGIKGEIEFDSDPDNNDLPLNFDPDGATIEIKQGATVYFTDVFNVIPGGNTDDPDGVTICAPVEQKAALVNTGVDIDAKGDARFRERDDCDQDFRVEIEDLPPGDYALDVGGINRGTVTVVDTGSEFEGQIEFDTEPEPDEELLDFDPRGELLEIKQGATVFLKRT
ncbi:MAG: hypothetical protein ABFS02_14920, partial [Pseudomonadota bacterium]